MSRITPRSATLSDGARRNVLRRRGLAPPSPAAAAGPHRAVDPRFAYAYGGGAAKRTVVSPLPLATKSRTPPRLSLDSVGTAASDASRLSLLQRRSLEPLTPIALNAQSPMAGTATGKTYVRNSRESSPLMLPRQPLSTRGIQTKSAHQSAAIPSASGAGRIPKSKATASIDRNKRLAILKRKQQRHRQSADCSSKENDGGASGNGATHTMASLAFSQRSSAETAKTKQREQANTPPRLNRSFEGGAENSPQKMPLEQCSPQKMSLSFSSIAFDRKTLAMKRAIIQRTRPTKKPTASPLKHMASPSSSHSIDMANKLISDLSNLTPSPAMRKLVAKYGTAGTSSPLPSSMVAAASPKYLETNRASIEALCQGSIKRQEASSSVGSAKLASRPSWVEVKQMSLEKSRSTAARRTSSSKYPAAASSPDILGRSRSPAVRSSTSKSPMRVPPTKLLPTKISPMKMHLARIPPMGTSRTRTPPAELIRRSRSLSRGRGERNDAYERSETKSVSAVLKEGKGGVGAQRAELAERHRTRRDGAPPLTAGRGSNVLDAALPQSLSNLRRDHLKSLSSFGLHQGSKIITSSSSSLPSVPSTKMSRQGNDDYSGSSRADAGGGNKTPLSQKLLLMDRGRSLVRQKQQMQDAKEAPSSSLSTSPRPPRAGSSRGSDGRSLNESASSESPLPPRGRKDGIESKQMREWASATSSTRAALSRPSHNSGDNSLHRDRLGLQKARSVECAQGGRGWGAAGADDLGVTQSCSFAASRSGDNGEAGRRDSSLKLRERRKMARQVLARRHGR